MLRLQHVTQVPSVRQQSATGITGTYATLLAAAAAAAVAAAEVGTVNSTRRRTTHNPPFCKKLRQVPGSTSVGTYLQESLGFLSQQQKGEWPTAIPNAAGAAAAGAGPSLGMAFLAGMSAGAEEAIGARACFGQGVMEMDTAAEERRPRGTFGCIDSPDITPPLRDGRAPRLPTRRKNVNIELMLEPARTPSW